MNEVIKYKDFDKLIKENYTNILDKYIIEWKEKFPFLQMFSVETDYDENTNSYNWLYILSVVENDLEINIFLEISKSSSWSFDFELQQISSGNIHKQVQKNYNKNGLDYVNFISEINKLNKFLYEYNQETNTEYNFLPLLGHYFK